MAIEAIDEIHQADRRDRRYVKTNRESQNPCVPGTKENSIEIFHCSQLAQRFCCQTTDVRVVLEIKQIH